MFAALLRESIAAARAQWILTGITALVVAIMCTAVLLTAGRTVGAQEAVLDRLDQAGSRTVVVRLEAGAGVDSQSLRRVSALDGVQWIGGFGRAFDVTSIASSSGVRVPVRRAYGADLKQLVGFRSPLPGAVYASPVALDRLGLTDGFGAVRAVGGVTQPVVASIATPAFLEGLEPLALSESEGPAELAVVVVVVARAALVPAISSALVGLLDPEDPTLMTVDASDDLVELRPVLDQQLAELSQGLVLVTLAIGATLVTIVLSSVVLLRRRDFGRRRALGATRGLIIGLLLAQTTAAAVVGVSVGVAVSLLFMTAVNDPVPPPGFIAAVGVLATAAAAMGGIIPGVVAATRDPLTELRVP